MYRLTLSTFAFILLLSTLAQSQKTITLEDLWQNYTFRTNTVPGFNFMKDGRHYTQMEDNKLVQYDLTTGEKVKALFDVEQVSDNQDFEKAFDGYDFNDDESKIIIQSGAEKIYRRSVIANYFIWDTKTQKLMTVLDEGKQRYVSFNPQSDKVAFVFENNLFYKDLTTGVNKQITTDGKKNEIINGGVDWVYEEEFSITKAYQWSPDGKYIAFLRFDEKEVPEFTMTLFPNNIYPEYETFKYPKVGEANATVTVHIYNIETGKTIKVDTEGSPDTYYPRIKWTKLPGQLSFTKMNRHQNELQLLLADAKTGQVKDLFKETNKYYIAEAHLDNLYFLEDGKRFIWTSEMDGHSHIYLYGMDGKKMKQLTKGDYDVTKFYGVDEKNKLVYFQTAERSPMGREVQVVSLNGKNKKNLTPTESGSSTAQFSSTFDYMVVAHSAFDMPPTYTVTDREGKTIRVIEDNAQAVKIKEAYDLPAVEFMKIPTSEGVQLNAWMIKPPNFNKNKVYPVFMYVYGGPGSQTVRDSYGGFNYWWFHMLAQQGYIVVSVDNRGTGARGEEFKKMTYLQLGKYETIDQIESAKYLAGLEYTDPGRIGIFGWSYGGFMSSLCLFKGNDVFKTAIAVAPVTSWKWYDTIYTERYMRTEKENTDGYKDNSPINFVDQLKGNYLLIHGMADDNVHFQNSAVMVSALINANKQFESQYYPDKNHGIYGGNTRYHLYKKMTDFLYEKL